MGETDTGRTGVGGVRIGFEGDRLRSRADRVFLGVEEQDQSRRQKSGAGSVREVSLPRFRAQAGRAWQEGLRPSGLHKAITHMPCVPGDRRGVDSGWQLWCLKVL